MKNTIADEITYPHLCQKDRRFAKKIASWQDNECLFSRPQTNRLQTFVTDEWVESILNEKSKALEQWYEECFKTYAPDIYERFLQVRSDHEMHELAIVIESRGFHVAVQGQRYMFMHNNEVLSEWTWRFPSNINDMPL